jgi:hypothetical protein
MTKREQIDTLRNDIHKLISYGHMDGIKILVDGFADMLLVVAEEPDYDEIAKRMAKVLLDQPLPGTVGVKQERGLPILGTITDDGILWSAGD